MIVIDQLSKQFGSYRAVDNLSLTINSPELFCLLGPNGAGKTTALKMLAGLMKPSAGNAALLGYDTVQQFDKIKGQVGFIPDTPFLYENLSVGEFFDFMGSIYQVETSCCRDRIQHYLNLFELEKHKQILIRDLSHGMRQKVLYISHLLHQPQILLIDEPFVGLDPKSMRQLKDVLRQQVKGGSVVFMSTHILEIAETIADRIGILDKGKLIACGTLAQLRATVSLEKLEDIFLRLTQ